MKRFVKFTEGYVDASTIVKVAESTGTITATVNFDSGTNGVDAFTVAGDADQAERLIAEINYSKQIIIDAANI